MSKVTARWVPENLNMHFAENTLMQSLLGVQIYSAHTVIFSLSYQAL